MKISACMIVKDSAGTIEACLESIRMHVSEICIYDTGSTDDTLKILRRLAKEKSRGYCSLCRSIASECACVEGAVVIDVPLAEIVIRKGEWRNDFAWARQQSFDMATDADWFFWLDDDDIVMGAENLVALASTAHPAVDGFVVYYDYARDGVGNTVCELWRERLIRNNGRFQWLNPVHEIYAIKEGLGDPSFLRVPQQQLAFVHNRPAEERYSATRNLDILEAFAAGVVERGEEIDLRTQAYLGTEKMAQGRFAEAAVHLQAYLADERSTVGDERSQVAHKFAICASALGNQDAAIEIEFTAIKERDDWAENAIGLCEFFAQKGEYKRCEIWAKRALDLGKPDTVLIMNPLDYGFLPFMRISEACAAMDRWDEAREWFEKAAALVPSHPDLMSKAQALEWESMCSAAVHSILQLRETYIRFDENWKAHLLLENVPYFLFDEPRIVAARAMQRENVMHALKPSEYTRWYEDEPKESTIGNELVENVGDMIPRAKFLLELCQRFEEEHGRKPRVLDMGCNDAWMACYLWLNGQYVADGVELNKASVEKGRERLAHFGAPGRIVQGNINEADYLLGTVTDDMSGRGPQLDIPTYDIIGMFEVYEHVPDVDQTLSVLERLVNKTDGWIAITTPNGAFDHGNIPMWHIVERKGHLRAVSWKEFLTSLADRDGRLHEVQVHQNNRLTYAVYRPGAKRKRVVIHAGGSWEPWSPKSIRTTGIGGSETALTHLAMRLALNHDVDVRVFSDAEPGLYGGSLWLPTQGFDPTMECDAFISSRNPSLFNVDIHAPVRALWCHDVIYPFTNEQFDRMTDIICLSEWQRDYWASHAEGTEEKLRIIRNGISLGTMDGDPFFPDAERGFEERKPKVVYSSSADRGLDVMLTVWPEIRKKVADAELHVFYGWETFDLIARARPELRAYKAKVEALLEACGGEEGGVFMRGRLPQPELYKEFQEARVWGYPTAFLETSCITAMEVRAAGCAIVTSDHGALHETVGEHGVLIPWGDVEEDPYNESERYQELFVGNVCDLLSKPAYWQAWHAQALMGVEDLTWDKRVEEWADLVGARVQDSPTKVRSH